jgi:hypothetical protein
LHIDESPPRPGGTISRYASELAIRIGISESQTTFPKVQCCAEKKDEIAARQIGEDGAARRRGV